MSNRLAAIIILDGWGLGKDYEGNAVLKASTPNYDRLINEYPNTKLVASGLSVGLPEGQMGNSEVGHLNIGAGRVVYQEFTRISKAIENGEFYNKAEFVEAIQLAKKNGTKLHLMGLYSNGGVHSHATHVYALLELAKKHDFKDVFVHCFLDGRDVAPGSAKEDVVKLEEKMQELGVGRIATVSGRYYAMDRDKRWERTQSAYDAMVVGKGIKASTPIEAVNKAFSDDKTDEFVPPTVIDNNGEPVATIDDGDAIIFFNFRPDRARQMTRAIVDEDFSGFERTKKVNVHFVSMTQYDKTIENVEVAYKPQSHKNTLGEYLSNQGLKQLRIAETEKYAHVTFFFNGGVEAPNDGEDRVLIPSPKVATYDLQPEMSAFEMKDQVVEKIQENTYDFLVLNFANPDMVGHTGNIDAAVKAVETVDTCLGEVVDAILKVNGGVLITADHGNSEEMINEENGSKLTAHTTNKVPCLVVGEGQVKLREGILADIAPTILSMLDLEQPEEMTGQSIIER